MYLKIKNISLFLFHVLFVSESQTTINNEKPLRAGDSVRYIIQDLDTTTLQPNVYENA